MVGRRIQGGRMKYQEALFWDKYEIALETIDRYCKNCGQALKWNE